METLKGEQKSTFFTPHITFATGEVPSSKSDGVNVSVESMEKSTILLGWRILHHIYCFFRKRVWETMKSLLVFHLSP
jgi:hypothetical protein